MVLNSVNVLLVEDNPADTHLIIDYFKDDKSNFKIDCVADGAQALEYLNQKGAYKNVSIPDIIILDMNLPKIEGMEVLKIIKADDNLNKVPVIIFGTSNDPIEIKKAYKNHANCYIVKPLNLDKLEHKLECIKQFWLNIVTIP